METCQAIQSQQPEPKAWPKGEYNRLQLKQLVNIEARSVFLIVVMAGTIYSCVAKAESLARFFKVRYRIEEAKQYGGKQRSSFKGLYCNGYI